MTSWLQALSQAMLLILAVTSMMAALFWASPLMLVITVVSLWAAIRMDRRGA